MQNYFNKFMKLSYNFKPLLHNRIILYLFFAVALFEAIYYLQIGDTFSFSTLILIGLLTSFFNKNMIIILFVAIVFTHILKYGRVSYSEGMENNEGDHKVVNKTTEKVMDEMDKIKDLTKKINTTIADSKDEKKNELIDNIQDIKETRDKIIENVQNMQPLLDKFQGYVEKFKEYKNSQNSEAASA